MKKLSVIIAALESYEVVRRQVLHFARMRLPESVEIIIMDDGSKPPIWKYKGMPEAVRAAGNVTIRQTGDSRPWSQPCARNAGAELSSGEYLLFTDIDHVLSRGAIEDALKGDYDKMNFNRNWGVLTTEGKIVQKKEILFAYGLPEMLYRKRKLHAGQHPNTFSMPKRIFMNLLGGYDERYCGRYGGDDVDFNKRYSYLCRQLKLVSPHILGRPIWVYPDARRDAKEVLHSMRRNKAEHYKLKGYVREDPICEECQEIYLKCKCRYGVQKWPM